MNMLAHYLTHICMFVGQQHSTPLQHFIEACAKWIYKTETTPSLLSRNETDIWREYYYC